VKCKVGRRVVDTIDRALTRISMDLVLLLSLDRMSLQTMVVLLVSRQVVEE
jgi:hypothetical protein